MLAGWQHTPVGQLLVELPVAMAAPTVGPLPKRIKIEPGTNPELCLDTLTWVKQEPVAFTTNPAASSAGHVLDLDTDDDASGDPDTQMVVPPLLSTNEAYPVGQHAPPVGQQALPVVQQAPPAVQQALAVVQQAPPAAAQAPPSGRRVFADMSQKEMQRFSRMVSSRRSARQRSKLLGKA